MATVSHLHTVASTANASSYASGSFTPTASNLLVAFVVASGTVAATPTLTASANGLTFSLVNTALFNTSANMVYAFVANQLVGGSPVAMTVTFDCTGDAATGAIIVVYQVASLTRVGLNAILQSAKVENHVSGATSIAFTSSVDTNNPTILCLGNSTSPPALTEPTGWAEPTGALTVGTNGDTGYSTPTTGMETCFRNSGFSGTGSITWNTNSASNYAIIGLELDTSAAASSFPHYYYQQMRG